MRPAVDRPGTPPAVDTDDELDELDSVDLVVGELTLDETPAHRPAICLYLRDARARDGYRRQELTPAARPFGFVPRK